MISSKSLAEQISLDLDQNAYTTWHDSKKILAAINSACEFLHAYTQRPWTLVLGENNNDTINNVFTFDHNIFFPYWVELDGDGLERTNIPIVGRDSESEGTFFVNGNTIATTKKGKKIYALYHRGHKKINSLGVNDLDIPSNMQQVLLHLSLWFIYPGGMDLGASLANQNFQMAEMLLATYAKAYGFDLQPSAVKSAKVYY